MMQALVWPSIAAQWVNAPEFVGLTDLECKAHKYMYAPNCADLSKIFHFETLFSFS